MYITLILGWYSPHSAPTSPGRSILDHISLSQARHLAAVGSAGISIKLSLRSTQMSVPENRCALVRDTTTTKPVLCRHYGGIKGACEVAPGGGRLPHEVLNLKWRDSGRISMVMYPLRGRPLASRLALSSRSHRFTRSMKTMRPH